MSPAAQTEADLRAFQIAEDAGKAGQGLGLVGQAATLAGTFPLAAGLLRSLLKPGTVR
jgi:hypothetical protein